MKLTTALCLLIASFGTLTTATPNPASVLDIVANPKGVCQTKNPRVVKAIDLFCHRSGTKLTVPSLFAHTGVYLKPQPPHSPNEVFVWIEGTCSPPQWVPQEVCRKQFFQMCATGGGKGGAKVRYGRDGCQGWNILVKKP
ncbi:uncharacterized protein MYCFIDRAFT_198838 [Pseudocercospora fijiensis CIRAD86]|uniref:Uncharacterized protein n=1 Tax=Pseudocercospora fijiensis (strain CIRAD86) TaxID=383855 RepID=M3AT64_PSEFD|nr:uncharacterized protein MYCFIDRAFT_198838 [Pseudocercospora fijiensis CIRAD86]EME80672.1 hypothetical protein MYCFIDRAFT_198838 [Pseudocercospora fijiensis CIRAD86]